MVLRCFQIHLKKKQVLFAASLNYSSFVLFFSHQLILRASAATYKDDTLNW